MSILQLNPTIPMQTPKGNGIAWLVIDEGIEHHLLWVVAITETGEVWTFKNPEVRAEKNITIGRVFEPLPSVDKLRKNQCDHKNMFSEERASSRKEK